MLFNDDIIDVEKSDGICSSTFAKELFALFLHPPFFLLNTNDLRK